MEERQLSLTEFSKELGIGKSSLQAYLNGQQNMRSDTIELIAEKLEITPAELVSYPAEQQPPSENLHPLLEPLLHGGLPAGGKLPPLQGDDKVGQLLAGLLLRLAPDLVAAAVMGTTDRPCGRK